MNLRDTNMNQRVSSAHPVTPVDPFENQSFPSAAPRVFVANEGESTFMSLVGGIDV